MNILYLATVRMPTEKASGLAIVRQCEAFVQLGNKVTLLYPRRKNKIKDNIFEYYGLAKDVFSLKRAPSIDLVDFAGTFGFALTRLSQMFAYVYFILLRKKYFDVIYTRDEWMLFLPLLFKIRKKMVWEAHTKHDNFVTRYVARNAHAIFTISGGLKSFYAEIGKRTDITVEPSGVNVTQFVDLPNQAIIRKKLHLPQERVVIGYVGKYTTMGEDKGIGELVKAFAGVYETLPATHLLIVGLEDQERDVVKDLCVAEGLSEDAFSLLPLIQKDFALYLEASDILVMNYPDTEHYRLYMSPTKLFAYMAAGKVIISSDLPSVREIVDESQVVFIQPGNSKEMTNSLIVVIQNLHEVKKKAFVAKNEVVKYSWENRSARILRRINATEV